MPREAHLVMDARLHNVSQMNNTRTDTTNWYPSPPMGLISADVDRFVNYALNFLWLFTIIVGLWLNALVIRTYYRMGLKDSVRICFFFQAIIDFITLMGPIGNLVIAVLYLLENNVGLFLKVQIMGVVVYLTVFAATCNILACINTTFLAVQRALCIVKPLHFRNLMNRVRTWSFLGVASVFCLVQGILYASGYQYRLVMVDPSTNTTRYIVFIAKHLPMVKFFVVTFVQLILFLFCQVLVFGSLIVMMYSLKASVQFRQSTATVKITSDQSQTKEAQKSSKERTAILQVSLVSFFFLLLNLPKFILAFVQWIEPEFEMNGRFYHIWSVCIGIRMTIEYFNTLVNFPIYYKYNSKFRQHCFKSKENSE